MYRVEINVVDDTVPVVGGDRPEVRETFLAETHRLFGDAKQAAMELADTAFNAKKLLHKRIAQRIEIPPHLSEYIDWNSIGRRADALKANIETRYSDGGILITLFWEN